MKKRLYRSTEDKKLAGVCGGLAEYLEMDPTIIRLIFVFFALFSIGLIVYIVAALVIPNKPDSDYIVVNPEQDDKEQ